MHIGTGIHRPHGGHRLGDKMRLPVDPGKNIVLGGDLPRKNTKEYIKMVIKEFNALKDDFYLAEVVVPKQIAGVNFARTAQTIIRRNNIQGMKFIYTSELDKVWVLRA